MPWTPLGLVIFLVLDILVLAALFLWLRRETGREIDNHRTTRQFVLRLTLERVDDPIIILGDCIVEASTLPRSLCVHAIINAGVGGTSTGSDLGSFLAGALGNQTAALIVVSLGTNDASASRSEGSFKASYSALLTQISRLAPHVVVTAIRLPTVTSSHSTPPSTNII
jgi:GDSL-like Lipase/Acylhydrolase family